MYIHTLGGLVRTQHVCTYDTYIHVGGPVRQRPPTCKYVCIHTYVPVRQPNVHPHVSMYIRMYQYANVHPHVHVHTYQYANVTAWNCTFQKVGAGAFATSIRSENCALRTGGHLLLNSRAFNQSEVCVCVHRVSTYLVYLH